MVRTTRSSARRLETPSTTGTPTTTTTTPSPYFSSKNSTAALTPATSEDENENENVNKEEQGQKESKLVLNRRRSTRTAAAKASTLGKRAKVEDSEDELMLSPAKKLIGPVKNRAYVEIETKFKKPSETPIKNKPVPANNKRKRGSGKSTPQILPTPVYEAGDDEGELISEDEVEFDENAELDVSDDSGSAFEASEDDEDEDEDFEVTTKRKSPRKTVPVSSDYDDDGDDEEAEAQMLSTAIELSKQETAEEHLLGNVSGPSSSSASALRAAAAERRLAKAKSDGLKDGRALVSHAEEAVSSDEDDEPLAKGKGKAKARVKGKGKAKAKAPANTKPKTSMTISDVRAERRRAAAEKRANKAEETALRRELGRKLTHAEKTRIALHKHHAELRTVWGDLELRVKPIKPQVAEQPEDLKITLLPFQLESLYWMRKQEEGEWHGGMLADEMGMGKTIQMLALLVSDRKRPNLIVAPTVAIMQWKNEIEAYTDGFKIAIWHGASREVNMKELQKFDVVLTAYSVLESAFRKQQSGFKRGGKIIKEKSPVHQIKWNRIILDEAHNIKERATNTSKAAFELKSSFKWCLSGTPLQNRVGELYSLVRFLGGDPFSFYFCKKCDCKSLHWRFTDKRTCDECSHSPMQHTCFWNSEILTPIQKNGLEGVGETAFKKLRILLDRMMLRRTKIERADDLGLPPRTVIIRRDYFSNEEKELYLSLFSDAKRQFSYYVDQGTLLNNYSNIFSLLTRMRQMACHPDLVLRSKQNASKFSTDDTTEATVCRICNDIAEDAIQSKCRHIFDRECIKQYINTAVELVPACPVCHLPLTIDLEAPALELDAEVSRSTVRQGILGRLDIDKWRSSSKIEALVEELTNLRRKDATTKSLVFSQFVNFLDLIAFRLQRAGFTICRLEGTMSPQARDATIQHFMKNVHVTVFLVSLKAGGIALNLTEASRVYLMDSWWNPAVEYQAMDRIHRLGQHRPVEAIKLVIEDSIESRIVQLQEKKSAMIDATLSTDDSAMGRLTPEDLGFLFRL
ncbi:SNF2 family N-terminal domain-containing protein [Phellopilus nigrolimitatus]|nr:SNF2 family N-terminal domain-containing protein [Phellopilus nigrolimitatus]